MAVVRVVAITKDISSHWTIVFFLPFAKLDTTILHWTAVVYCTIKGENINRFLKG